MPKRPLNDQQLALRSRKRDEDAFRELVSRYRDRLFAYLRHLGLGREEAEDILQDVFIKAYRALAKFDARRRFSPWIYRIAHNEAVNQLKRRSRRTLVSWDDIATAKDKLDIADLADSPQEALADKEDREEMRRALDCLSVEHREILVLRYYHDKSYSEMSEILGMPANTIASRIHRAKEKLIREMLGDAR